MTKVLVAPYGYSQRVPEGFRPWEPVITSRISKTLKVADFFRKHGFDVDIVISGGTKVNGIKEAEAIHRFALERFPQISRYPISLDVESQRSRDNASILGEIAYDKGADLVIPISNKDHISRIARDWAYLNGKYDFLSAAIAAPEAYSKLGKKGALPEVIEPPVWFRDLVNELLCLPPEKREKVYRGIKALLI